MGELDRGGAREGITNTKLFFKAYNNVRLAQS